MKVLIFGLCLICLGCALNKKPGNNVSATKVVSVGCLKERPVAPYLPGRVDGNSLVGLTEEEAAKQVKQWYIERNLAIEYASKWERAASGCSVISSK